MKTATQAGKSTPTPKPASSGADGAAVGAGQTLTTNQGVPIGDNQHSLKAGLRGPSLLEDFILREKITHFDHERIPERIVHARGSAAHGYFEAYQPLTDLTHAAPFQAAGKLTPVFVRFSTVAGERDSSDTAQVEVMDFVANQHRHGKTILALGAAKALPEKAGVVAKLASGAPDPGIVMAPSAKAANAAAAFISALVKHRHPEREAGAAAP